MTKPTSHYRKGILAEYHANFHRQNFDPKRPIDVAAGDGELSVFVGHLRVDIWPAEGYLGGALGKLKGKLKGASRTSVRAG